jgi:hypothetical protein
LRCTFSPNCDKKIKGKGNLRRHIEWHLRRVEEETRNNYSRVLQEGNLDFLRAEEQRKILQEKLTDKYLKPKTVSESIHFGCTPTVRSLA